MTQNNGGVYNRRKRSLERQQKTVLKKTLKFESLLKLFSTQIPRNEQEKAYLIDYPNKDKAAKFLGELGVDIDRDHKEILILKTRLS